MPPKFATGDHWARWDNFATPYYRIQLGEATIHVLAEANGTIDPSGIFPARVMDWLNGDSEEQKQVRSQFIQRDGTLAHRMMFAAMLLQADGKNVMLDTSCGELEPPFPMPAERFGAAFYKVPETLERYAKVRTEDIDFVVHSHLHPDHIGWNIRVPTGGAAASEPVPTFPRATHIIQRPEWDYPAKRFACPWRGQWELKCAPLERKGMVKLVEGDFQLLPSACLLGTAGHTPGHQCVRIESGGHVAYYLGDAIHTVLQVSRPELCPVFDCCALPKERKQQIESPELPEGASVQHRRELLRRAHEEGALLLSPHLPFPGIGRIGMHGGRYYWRPVTEKKAGGLLKYCAWCCSA